MISAFLFVKVMLKAINQLIPLPKEKLTKSEFDDYVDSLYY